MRSGASDTWWNPPDKLDLEFERGELIELGDGRLAVRGAPGLHAEGDGRVRVQRRRRVELTVRDGKVSRYEMRSVG